MTKKKKIVLSITGAAVVGLGIWLGPLIPPLIKYFQDRNYYKTKIEYYPACKENIALLGAAINAYLESEGVFPPAEKWMDEIQPYLRSNEKTKEDQLKKLHCPDLSPEEFGYAYNAQLAGKSKDAIGDQEKTPVVYDSTQTSKNANDAMPFESVPKSPRAGGNNVFYANGTVSAYP